MPFAILSRTHLNHQKIWLLCSTADRLYQDNFTKTETGVCQKPLHASFKAGYRAGSALPREKRDTLFWTRGVGGASDEAVFWVWLQNGQFKEHKLKATQLSHTHIWVLTHRTESIRSCCVRYREQISGHSETHLGLRWWPDDDLIKLSNCFSARSFWRGAK